MNSAMSLDEKVMWCIEQAEQIERKLAPQSDPHLWDSPRITADFLRRFADRLRGASARVQS